MISRICYGDDSASVEFVNPDYIKKIEEENEQLERNADVFKEQMEDAVQRTIELQQTIDSLMSNQESMYETNKVLLNKLDGYKNTLREIINYVNANHYSKDSKKINEIMKKYDIGSDNNE